jgi:hypothetical protein
MRALTRPRNVLITGVVAAAVAMLGMPAGPVSAATGVKVSPSSGPVGTTIKVSGSCGSDAGGGTWFPTRLGLYYKDAFQNVDSKSTFAESTAKTAADGAFTGTIRVPATAKYDSARPTPATPGPEVTRDVSGKLGVQVLCQSSLSAYPWSAAHLDDVFTVTTAVKTFTVSKKPSIKGKAKVGKKLKARLGTWSPAPSDVSYQWKRGKKDIANATRKKYKVKQKDAGKKISVVVSGEKAGYKPLSVRSAKLKIKAS